MNGATNKRFTFVVHYVETWNWLLPIFGFLNRRPELARLFLWLTPLFVLMAELYRLLPKPFTVIDEFKFSGVPGDTLAVNNFGYHYLIKRFRKGIKQRICDTVLAAQQRGSTVVGLGALNKAEWLTNGGEWIVKELGDRLKVPLVHGDSLTAAVVIEQALGILSKIGEKQVYLIGPTSKIGRAVALSLVRNGIRVVMKTNSRRRYEAIMAEAGKDAYLLEHTDDLEDGSDCRLWITGKSDPSGAELIRHLPQDAVVLNFSVPDPLTPKVLKSRPDVRHFDGGLMAYSPSATSIHNTIRLVPGLTYACHAGTIVHAHMGWNEHEVGAVDVDRLSEYLGAAYDVGFRLPSPTSFLKPDTRPLLSGAGPTRLELGVY
jgi:predicted amino acid dehydrogenase